MRKKLLIIIVTIFILLVVALLSTPYGGWLLFMLTGGGEGHVLVIIAAIFAIAIIMTLPESVVKARRKWFCLAVAVIATFIVASSMDLGGNLQGEWVLVRDANIESFRIANTPDARLRISEDSVSLTDLNHRTGNVRESGIGGNRIVIGWRFYEYSFRNFGRRLVLSEVGSELPRRPILTTQRDVEIVFRRTR